MAKRRPTAGKDDLGKLTREQLVKRLYDQQSEEIAQVAYRRCKATATDPLSKSRARASVAIFLGLAAVRGAFYLRDCQRTGRCDSETVLVYTSVWDLVPPSLPLAVGGNLLLHEQQIYIGSC